MPRQSTLQQQLARPAGAKGKVRAELDLGPHSAARLAPCACKQAAMLITKRPMQPLVNVVAIGVEYEQRLKHF